MFREQRVLKPTVLEETHVLKSTRRTCLLLQTTIFLHEYRKDQSIKWGSKHFMTENLQLPTLDLETMIPKRLIFQNHIQYEEKIKMLEMIGRQGLDNMKLKIIIKRSKERVLNDLNETLQQITKLFIPLGLLKKFKQQMTVQKITDLNTLFQKILVIKTIFKGLKVFECSLVQVIIITKMLLVVMDQGTQ